MSEHPIARVMMVKGAVASVSLSHEPSCDCNVCKAAHGDTEALAYFLRLLSDRDDG